MALWRVLQLLGISENGGASVTVSRTHTSVSLCFQIITFLNRFGDQQAKALFSDGCERQRLSCLPKFQITGV
jgi:hypothetical protein